MCIYAISKVKLAKYNDKDLIVKYVSKNLSRCQSDERGR